MLYEDDFEFEEQPENIRERNAPGKGGRQGGGNRERRGRRPRTETAPVALPESAKPAHELLKEILTQMGVGHVEIAYIPRPEGEYLEIDGPDLAMLIGRHGNTLEALNLVFNNILNAGQKNNRKYYTIDAEGYRAYRAERLKDLAFETLDRVLREGHAVKLEPMLPSERKIVHLTLADDGRVRTESEGVEPERCLVVFPA